MTTPSVTNAANPFIALDAANQANAAASAATKAGSSSSSGSGTSINGLQSSDFLKLMLTQLQNQDPTQPTDTAAMSAQFAQIGTVTGIDQLNSSFSTLASAYTSNQALQASSLLGRDVLVDSSTAALGASGGVSGAVAVPTGSGPVTLGVYGAGGALVKTIPLGTPSAGNASFTWDGTNSSGARMPAGTYTVKAQGLNGTTPTSLQTLIAAQVQSVTLNGGGSAGGLTLSVAGIGNVPLSSVTQISQ